MLCASPCCRPLLCDGLLQRTGCCGVLVASLDPDEKSRCWTEATNRLSLCLVCVEESICCHVPSLKKFGVCFSWEVPVCDLTKQFSAVQPQTTAVWGPCECGLSAVAGDGLDKCPLAGSSRNTKCSLLCYLFVRGSCCSRVFSCALISSWVKLTLLALEGGDPVRECPWESRQSPNVLWWVDISEGVDVQV